MKQLLVLNNDLPQVLQDLISVHNVEHRQKMNNVLRELTTHKPFMVLMCECYDIGIIDVTLYSCMF